MNDGDGFYFNCLVVMMLLWQFFFVSNPYHVVLNRQSSGERGAQLDQTDTIESEAVTTPRVTEAEIKRETETTRHTNDGDGDGDGYERRRRRRR